MWGPAGRPPWSDQVRRSGTCTCCHRARVRIRVKVGTLFDPDYAVAVCPACDGVDPTGLDPIAWAVDGPLRPAPPFDGEEGEPWAFDGGSATWWV